MKLEDSFLDLKLNENLRAFREKHRSEYLVLFKLKAFWMKYKTVLLTKQFPNKICFCLLQSLNRTNCFKVPFCYLRGGFLSLLISLLEVY